MLAGYKLKNIRNKNPPFAVIKILVTLTTAGTKSDMVKYELLSFTRPSTIFVLVLLTIRCKNTFGISTGFPPTTLNNLR